MADVEFGVGVKHQRGAAHLAFPGCTFGATCSRACKHCHRIFVICTGTGSLLAHWRAPSRRCLRATNRVPELIGKRRTHHGVPGPLSVWPRPWSTPVLRANAAYRWECDRPGAAFDVGDEGQRSAQRPHSCGGRHRHRGRSASAISLSRPPVDGGAPVSSVAAGLAASRESTEHRASAKKAWPDPAPVAWTRGLVRSMSTCRGQGRDLARRSPATGTPPPTPPAPRSAARHPLPQQGVRDHQPPRRRRSRAACGARAARGRCGRARG
jgi:hypothetical protein